MRVDRRELAAIFAGGFIGALARGLLDDALPADPGQWPWATFIANLAGAALLGYFVTRLQERLPLSSYRRPFLGTGVCGALTTFSTLIRRLRQTRARGATTMRGIWGYHGDHPPHGDRFFALRRHVPMVTVIVDTPTASVSRLRSSTSSPPTPAW